MARKNYPRSKVQKRTPKRTSRRAKKYSLNERVEHYNKEYAKGSPKKKAFCAGFIDAVRGVVSGSKFDTDAERESYYDGVNRGNYARDKSENVKF